VCRTASCAWICEFSSGFAALHEFAPRFEPVDILRELPHSAPVVALVERYSKARREIVVWLILNQFDTSFDEATDPPAGLHMNAAARAEISSVECSFLLSQRGAAAICAAYPADVSFLA
jgi:hypothetical protein